MVYDLRANVRFSLRGGTAVFQKKISVFFRSTKLIFRDIHECKKDPNLAKIFTSQAIFWKKQANKGVFRRFLNNFGLKIAFLALTPS